MADKTYWKARLIFAACICAAAIAALAWSRWSAGRYTTYTIETHDAVTGLLVDAPVEFRGVEVGNVSQITLRGPLTVRVLLRIRKDAPVSARTVATITSRGLTPRGFAGYVYVALDDTGSGTGPVSQPTGEPFPIIATAPFKALTVDATAAEALQRVQELTQLLQELLNEGTISSIKSALQTFQELTQVLQRLLNEDTVSSVKSTLQRAQELTQTLQQLLNQETISSVNSTLSGIRDVTSMLLDNSRRLESLITNAESDSRQVQPLLRSGETIVRELRTELLPEFYRAINDLDALARSMQPVANRLSRDPSAILRGTTVAPGPGER
jgi:phospholipid/cholesterol/gamma-HCH transport system substrate-binding protein